VTEASLRGCGASISFAPMSPFRTFALLLGLLLAGCRLGSTAQSDEQKDPYFLAGKNRLQERDYPGAVEMFEKALDVNPRSASAHFELGVLYEQQQNDFAAALYHYQRTVTLNSNTPFADLARQRMQECKRELARSVMQPLSMESLQREMETLRAENQRLKQQLQQWQSYYEGRGVTLSNFAPVPTNAAPRPAPAIASLRGEPDRAPLRSSSGARSNTPAVSTRTHTVAYGETLASIARRYNIKLSTLQTANPSVEAKRLRAGQTLTIPSP